MKGYSTPTCSGKIASCTGPFGNGVIVTEPKGSCAYKNVTYTIKFCNQDTFPFTFKTGTCNYTATGAPLNGRSGPCSYAYVNQDFVDGDFSSTLPAGVCRYTSKETRVNTCAITNTEYSESVTSQIQLQGTLNGNYCRAYGFMSVVYKAADPPKPTAKPTSKPTKLCNVSVSIIVYSSLIILHAIVFTDWLYIGEYRKFSSGKQKKIYRCLQLSTIHLFSLYVWIQGYSTQSCGGKMNDCSKVITEPRGSCGIKDVSYTFEVCNNDNEQLTFQTGTCVNPITKQVGPCSYSHVNGDFHSNTFTAILPPSTCFYTNVPAKVNTCPVSGDSSDPVRSNIHIQGHMGGNVCQADVSMTVAYIQADPPQTKKPSVKKSSPTTKPKPAPVSKGKGGIWEWGMFHFFVFCSLLDISCLCVCYYDNYVFMTTK